MELLSVNTGESRATNNKTGFTGIYKTPQSGPVHIGSLGLARDAVCDTINHGGVDQAVYVYGMPDYEWWAAELGRTLEPGTFGENLTVSGLESAAFHIGDRLRVGAVLLEVTAPRIPCETFAARMGDPKFVKRFRHAERPGLYCRVIEEGAVQAGDPVQVALTRSDTIGVIGMYRLYYERNADADTLRALLAMPIDVRARRDYEAKLAELEAQAG